MAHSNWKCPIEIKLKGPFDTLRKKLSQSLMKQRHFKPLSYTNVQGLMSAAWIKVHLVLPDRDIVHGICPTAKVLVDSGYGELN